jgi:hypothetical protein
VGSMYPCFPATVRPSTSTVNSPRSPSTTWTLVSFSFRSSDATASANEPMVCQTGQRRIVICFMTLSLTELGDCRVYRPGDR